jgi:uncharacterized protein (DUF1330 family)
MAGYFILQSKISDAAAMSRYRQAVMPLIERFGGRHIARAAVVEVLEGRHDGRRLSIFEFPSLEAVHEFWNSADYIAVKELRRGAAEFDIWAVAGVAAEEP